MRYPSSESSYREAQASDRVSKGAWWIRRPNSMTSPTQQSFESSFIRIILRISWAALLLLSLSSLSWAGDSGSGVFHDYKGTIHMHSTYSDGKGTIEEIAAAARQVGLDFVITTDHDTLDPLAEGKEGWYEGVLVLAGSEITTKAGYYLALNISQLPSEGDPRDHVEQIKGQGGMSFVAHPFGFRDRWDWANWTVPGFTGMEIYDLTDDLLKESLISYIKFFFVGLFNPRETFSSYLDRPTKELQKWDELTLQWRMIGIGGTNVHAKFRVFGRTIDPYWKLFKLVHNHVLVKEGFTGDLEHDKPLLYGALSQGHVYVSFGIWGEARGFSFRASNGEQELMMGEEATWGGPVRLRADLPQEGLVKLIRDGEVILEAGGKTLDYEVRDRGVYRVEAYRNVEEEYKLWIISNPIYLR